MRCMASKELVWRKTLKHLWDDEGSIILLLHTGTSSWGNCMVRPDLRVHVLWQNQQCCCLGLSWVRGGQAVMAWNASFIRPFVPRAGEEQAVTFLYDHHGINAHYPPGVEMKWGAFGVVENPQKVEAPGSDQKINNQDRKRRLTSEQIDSLERCFQEEVKLEPERKMKLAFELGLQPRQVAVWFQNRRARWKAKELERLYLALKQDFDAISNQKQLLQEEVIKLKAKLEERSVAAAHTEVSGEETVESTSVVIPSSNKSYGTSYYQVGECSYIFNVDDCNNPVSLPYWGVLPAYI